MYYEECDTCPVTTNSPAITFTNGPADLATNTTASGIFSNFNFDANYRLVIVGSDRAGNRGAFSDTVDVQTVNFIVTQGLTRVSTVSAVTSNQVESRGWRRRARCTTCSTPTHRASPARFPTPGS